MSTQSHLDDPTALDRAAIDAAARAAIAEYIADCRARVPDFCRRTFGPRGAVAVHKHAIGRDLLRAPANVAMAVPRVLGQAGARALRKAGAKRAAARLAFTPKHLTTDVQREVARRVRTELLRLPAEDAAADGDALAEAILRQPAIAAALNHALHGVADRIDDAETRDRLTAALTSYAETRGAATEVAANMATAAVGAALYNQLTPGAASLAVPLAHSLAGAVAASSFPLGKTLGALYYAVIPAGATTALTVGTAAGVLAATAPVAAFGGLVTDPIQQVLGLHQRRLNKLIDEVEVALLGDDPAAKQYVDGYVARVFDLIDLLGAARGLVLR